MAMRPAGRGAAGQRRPATPVRQGVGVQPVYVDFKPVSEWKQEKEADIVLIYLPGFLKQNLKVSTEGQNMVRARGERLDAGNRWSRFQEDYQVPERCDIRAIRARFEGGVLTVTMPWTKDWILHQSQVPNAEVIQPPPKPSSSTIPNVENEPTTPPKHTPEGPIDSTPQMVRADDDIPPIRPKLPPQMPLLTADDKKVGEPLPRKGPVMSGERERLPASPKTSLKPPTSRIDNDTDMKKGESVKNTGKSAKNLESSNEKQHSGIPDNRMKKEIAHSKQPKQEKMDKQTAESTSSDYGLGNYKEAVKSLAELKEERQLLVNVGAAVLVILALGTYIITSRLVSGDDN